MLLYCLLLLNKNPAAILILVPLRVICLFLPLWLLLRLFSLSLVIRNSIMMCLGAWGSLRVLDLWVSHFLRFGKLSAIISLSNFSVLSSFEDSNFMRAGEREVVSQLTDSLLVFPRAFYSLYSSQVVSVTTCSNLLTFLL